METHFYTLFQPTFETQEQCQEFAYARSDDVVAAISDYYRGAPFEVVTAYCGTDTAVQKIWDQTEPFVDGESI
jgi:hypothetical protein